MNTKQNFLQITILFIIATFFIQPCLAYRSVEFYGVENRDVIREDTLREEARFGDYEIKIYRDWDIGVDGVVQITKGGELVFEEQYHKYSLGASDGDMKLDHSPEIGKEITGDGEPNLVFSHWSGGAHCCFDVYVFSIGDEFRFIDKIEGEHGFYGFEDLDEDGIPEFIGYDWTFAYWKASFAGSPAPKIILKYKDGNYHLAYDLMKKEAINDSEYFQTIQDQKELVEMLCKGEYKQAWIKGGDCVTAYFWGHMLDLIYTGHVQEAWAFVDRAWDVDQVTKEAFLRDFKGQLALSDYAYDLPLDLTMYNPDIEDEAEKKDLRFKIYYDAMKESLDSMEGESGKELEPPAVDSLREKGMVDDALRGWAGQR